MRDLPGGPLITGICGWHATRYARGAMMSKRERAKRLFQIVLLGASAATPVAACGGSVDAVPSGSGGPSGKATPPEDGDPSVVRKPPPNDGGRDVGLDTTPDRVQEPDGWTQDQCFTGAVAPDPSYCCEDGGTCTGAAGGGDGQCRLDCKTVCAPFEKGQPGGFEYCYWGANGDAQIHYVCGACGVGRIPGDVAPCDEGSSVAERLAMQAYYEAASVIAFERTAKALAANGAPAHLVARLVRAAAEEARHAALFRELAEKRGAVVELPRAELRTPSLVEIALENATEGCVRETYGAVVAMHQAEHASDAELRAAFASIADDEADHAALSWELGAWLETQLPPHVRARVDAAHAGARAAQRALLDREGSALDTEVGLPRRSRALALFDAAIDAASSLAA
jgi:rubrerythrin